MAHVSNIKNSFSCEEGRSHEDSGLGFLHSFSVIFGVSLSRLPCVKFGLLMTSTCFQKGVSILKVPQTSKKDWSIVRLHLKSVLITWRQGN